MVINYNMDNDNIVVEFKLADNLPEVATPFKEADEDFDAVRSSMLTLIEKGNQGLQAALDIAIATEQPRAIDSFAGLLKIMGELNTKIIDLHQAKADMKSGGATGNNIKATTVNQTANNFFAGSTDDLQKMLAELAEKSAS